MNSELLQGFRLRGWRVEPLKGQVTGAAGERHLPPKAVDVLLRLAERPHKLVTREELLELVWGDGNGTQEALGHAVSDLRHAFDDHHDDPWLIQTLPKRGYRLICAPELESQEVPPEVDKNPKRNWWDRLLRHGVVQAAAAYLVAGWLLVQVADTTFDKIPLPPWSEKFVTFMVIFGFPLVILIAWSFEFVKGRVHTDRGEQSGGLLQGLERNYLAIFISFGVAAIGAGVYQASVGFDVPQPPPLEIEPVPVVENSIAVLPLATFDNDPRVRAFSDGLAEDIIDGLARIPGVSVSSRGDSWSLPANAPSDLVRRRLRVANYIEGSVRFLDDELKVVVQLIDSNTGFHLFSRAFETDIAGIGDMQREITQLVIANLKLAVDDSSVTDYVIATDTDNPDAYLSYRTGRSAMYEPATIETINRAIDNFSNALAVDDEYPAAHAGLCDAYVALYRIEENAVNIERAQQACSKALSVAPRLPIVLRSVGDLYLLMNRITDAESSFQLALEIDRQDAEALRGLAQVRRQQQRFDEAVSLMQRSIDLQPGNWRAINSLGSMYYRAGAYVEAAAQFRKVVYLDPDNFVTFSNLAATSMMTGDFDVAREAMLRAVAIEENPTSIRNLAAADYYLGNYASAIDEFRRAIDLTPTSIVSWVGLADALLASGETDAARDAYSHCAKLAQEQLGSGANRTYALMILAWATAMSAEADTAVSLVRQAIETDPALTYVHYYAALVYWYVGDRDMAFAAVEQALETGYPLQLLDAEPILRELREDPRYVAVTSEYK